MGFVEKLKEAAVSVLPVAAIVILVHFFLVPMESDMLLRFIIGTLFVVFGLMIFLQGVEMGVSPMGEHIGSAITHSKKIWFVIIFGFIIGAMITIAEPDVTILANQVNQASGGEVTKNLIMFSVATGVGIFVAFALFRIVMQFSLRKTLIVCYGIVFIMAFLTPPDFLSIAFDSGGVTTGAMTVPFLLALGIGVSSMRSGKSSEEDSFGIVGISSIGPILAVLILGVLS